MAKLRISKTSNKNILNSKLYNKMYRKVTRTAKKYYFDAKLAKYAKDVRNTWKIINTWISNKKTNMIFQESSLRKHLILQGLKK